jgi:hypothetical protein
MPPPAFPASQSRTAQTQASSFVGKQSSSTSSAQTPPVGHPLPGPSAPLQPTQRPSLPRRSPAYARNHPTPDHGMRATAMPNVPFQGAETGPGPPPMHNTWNQPNRQPMSPSLGQQPFHPLTGDPHASIQPRPPDRTRPIQAVNSNLPVNPFTPHDLPSGSEMWTRPEGAERPYLYPTPRALIIEGNNPMVYPTPSTAQNNRGMWDAGGLHPPMWNLHQGSYGINRNVTYLNSSQSSRPVAPPVRPTPPRPPLATSSTNHGTRLRRGVPGAPQNPLSVRSHVVPQFGNQPSHPSNPQWGWPSNTAIQAPNPGNRTLRPDSWNTDELDSQTPWRPPNPGNPGGP